MLQVSSVHKRYGDNTILENVCFVVNPGDRLGLIGPNGCGKTTLLRIIAGREEADRGAVQLSPPGLRLGYLEQGLTHAPEATVAEMLPIVEDELAAAEARLAELARALATAAEAERAGYPHFAASVQRQSGESPRAGYPHFAASVQRQSGESPRARLERAYSWALAELEALATAQPAAHDARAVLAGLGLGEVPLDAPVGTLSGGQKTRLGLARLLLDRPQVLLLDEPTNHLDIAGLEWLEGWLRRYPGAALIVSHDRSLLDNTVTGILELDPLTHTVRAYPGNYSAYAAAKEAEREQQWQEYSDQNEEIARLKAAARHLRGLARPHRGGKADGGDKFAKGFFANRGRLTVRRAKHIEERIEHLLTDERVDKPKPTWQMKLDFAATPASGRDVLALEGLAVGYGDSVLLRDVNQLLRLGERVALVGPNGSGKTTLLRVIAGQLAPLAGRVQLGVGVRVGYYSQEQENLDPASTPFALITAATGLPATDVRSFLHYFLFAGDDVFTPVGDLSYGERARLALAHLVATRCNCLLLDEPVNHLDIPSRASFEQAMATFTGTVLVAVHDRYFIRQFASRIWAVGEGRVTSHIDLEEWGRRKA